MRRKQSNVCHTCRRHKIGCDGTQPACSQCQWTGRQCEGYVQDMVILQHETTQPRQRVKSVSKRRSTGPNDMPSQKLCPNGFQAETGNSMETTRLQPTWEESVALLTQHYIPKDELPFVSLLDPSMSRICGGWVQALPHVSQSGKNFTQILSPAVRTLTLAMMVTGSESRQEYLDTYGDALLGIRSVLAKCPEFLDNTVAIAAMCLALSEVLMPTSSDGWMSHLRGVAAMMHSRGPEAFRDGVPHLLFVGFRPLIILDSVSRCKRTFLMDESWRNIPFTEQQASPMQQLLGHGAIIPSLLEQMNQDGHENADLKESFLSTLQILQDWEDGFSPENQPIYQLIAATKLGLEPGTYDLPDRCFKFPNISAANSLTHCWAFRIVCLLQLRKLEPQLPTNPLEASHSESVLKLCTLICRGLPYFLQKDMNLYGPLSAGFPHRMVLAGIEELNLRQDGLHMTWYKAIEEQLCLLGVPIGGP